MTVYVDCEEPKLRYGAHAISAEQILLSATLHGARALGSEGAIAEETGDADAILKALRDGARELYDRILR